MSVVAVGIGPRRVEEAFVFVSIVQAQNGGCHEKKPSRSGNGHVAVVPALCAAFAAEPTTPSSPPSMSVISYKMSGVAGDLAKKETGEPVQKQEKRIVTRSRRADRGSREGMRELQGQQGAEQSAKSPRKTR